MHISIGCKHHRGVPGSSQSIQFIWALFVFAHQVHWCSWIDHEFSLFWSFWSGCQHYPRFNGSIKRSFVRILDLVIIFRQIPCYSAGASFLVQGLLMWSLLEFWRATTSLMRFTLWDYSSRKTLSSRIFIWCQVPLENLTACFDPNFPSSLRMDLLGKESWDTQPNCVDSFNKATDPFAPSFFDFLLGFSSASTCLKKHFLPYMHPVSDL